ncbi:MAG: 50S ribosomal protein L5 [archaeon]
MKQVLIDKVVVSMGVGTDDATRKKASQIIQLVTGMKPVETLSKSRIPDWDLRPGVPIGYKVTLRGEKAAEFLKNGLDSRDKKIPAKSFDKEGNFAFGIKEHINLPGIKYDPKVGIMGFDVLVSLKKRGYRLKYRQLKNGVVGRKQRVSTQEAIEFVKAMGVEVA